MFLASSVALHKDSVTRRIKQERLVVRITKTCLYNFDPLKPHFYIVKLGFTGVYIIFLISAQNIDLSTRSNRLVEAVRTSTHNLCFV